MITCIYIYPAKNMVGIPPFPIISYPSRIEPEICNQVAQGPIAQVHR